MIKDPATDITRQHPPAITHPQLAGSRLQKPLGLIHRTFTAS